MGYNYKKWKERLATRTDMTIMVTHLTKPSKELNAFEVLLKILEERTLIGSSPGEPGFIVGNNRTVCFQEAPMYSLAQNVYLEQQLRKNNPEAKIRYYGMGVSFSKNYLYNAGARPVIYEKTERAKELLSPEEYWRIVNYDLSDSNNIIDWTHEREWRIKGDFTFDLEEVVVILPNSDSYKKFLESDTHGVVSKLKGIINIGLIFF